MDSDKLLTIIVSIAVIGYLAIKLFPIASTSYNETKKELEGFENQYIFINLDKYIEDRPNYYFKYEGAVYCIPVKKLVEDGIIKEDKAKENINNIIEATYNDGQYSYKYNINCKEK